MARKKSTAKRRFDFEALYLGVGVGVVCAALGVFILWALETAPEGGATTTGFTVAQRLARTLPDNLQQGLAFGLAVLFVLFGVFSILLGLWGSVKGFFSGR
jgi:ABC-type Mn2+/Zn2+ transport system permease subunit